jgi:hypothetical protein
MVRIEPARDVELLKGLFQPACLIEAQTFIEARAIVTHLHPDRGVVTGHGLIEAPEFGKCIAEIIPGEEVSRVEVQHIPVQANGFIHAALLLAGQRLLKHNVDVRRRCRHVCICSSEPPVNERVDYM